MVNEMFTPKAMKAIESLAARTGKPVDYYQRKARKAILEMIEDEQDYLDAVEASKSYKPEELISAEEMKKRLGLGI